MKNESLIPSERIEQSILLIRGHKVMLDRDLAELYGVKAIALRQAVKRNPKRFPDDFIFQLSIAETENLVSQNVIPSKRSLGGSLPYVFTEQGVTMLSCVLNSDRAILVNVSIMRVFIQMRQVLASQSNLMKKIIEMEKKYDRQFVIVFDAIKQLMAPPNPTHRKIGFRKE